MLVSIVIPAYNEEKYLGKTLESIKKLKINGWQNEILVVNGCSQDKTAEVAAFYNARVITVPCLSIGFARQKGLMAAKGEIVAFTDADTLVPSDWLKKHVEVLLKPGIVCSYGPYRLTDGYFPYYHITNYLWPVLVSSAYRFGIYLAAGQNIAVRKKEALEIGGFDESLEQLEDADLVKRIEKKGKVVFLSDNSVYSSGRRSKEGWRFYWRTTIANFRFFVLGRKKFEKFTHYR